MARIRTVKPEFWSSPGHKTCRDPYARLLFIAMWNWADDQGRGTANARELAGFAFPWDEELSSADIRRMLGGIRRAFGVVFYEVDGRPYYWIPSWEKHQKIDKRSDGRYPAPEDGVPWDPDPEPEPPTTPQRPEQHKHAPSMEPAEPSEEPSETPPSPRRDLGAGTGEQGNRGTGELGRSSAPLTLRTAGASAQLRLVDDEPIEGELLVAESPPPPENAGQLNRQWIDHCKANDVRLTNAHIKRYGAGIKRALGEGFDVDLVKRALAEMLRDRVASRPGLLDNYLIRVQQGAELPPRRATQGEAAAIRMAAPGTDLAADIHDTLTRPA